MSQPAVFLDRDKTIIEDPGFIDDPALVRLTPDAPEAIRRFRSLGFKVVVATNQSGIARGLLTEEQLGAVHDRMSELLRRAGTSVDAIYHCPYLDGPAAVVDAYRRDSELRKPSPGMLLQAAREMDLDLPRSWMIGDRPGDVEAGRRAGCRTILVTLGQAEYNGTAQPDFRAESLLEAANIVETNSIENRPEHVGSQHAPTTPTNPREVELLSQIRDLLDRQQRSQVQDDFSFLRLFGALAQMLAVVAAIWALFGMFDQATIAASIARFGLAAFLQLVTLTTFIIDRRR